MKAVRGWRNPTLLSIYKGFNREEHSSFSGPYLPAWVQYSTQVRPYPLQMLGSDVLRHGSQHSIAHIGMKHTVTFSGRRRLSLCFSFPYRAWKLQR